MYYRACDLSPCGPGGSCETVRVRHHQWTTRVSFAPRATRNHGGTVSDSCMMFTANSIRLTIAIATKIEYYKEFDLNSNLRLLSTMWQCRLAIDCAIFARQWVNLNSSSASILFFTLKWLIIMKTLLVKMTINRKSSATFTWCEFTGLIISPPQAYLPFMY